MRNLITVDFSPIPKFRLQSFTQNRIQLKSPQNQYRFHKGIGPHKGAQTSANDEFQPFNLIDFFTGLGEVEWEKAG